MPLDVAQLSLVCKQIVVNKSLSLEQTRHDKSTAQQNSTALHLKLNAITNRLCRLKLITASTLQSTSILPRSIPTCQSSTPAQASSATIRHHQRPSGIIKQRRVYNRRHLSKTSPSGASHSSGRGYAICYLSAAAPTVLPVCASVVAEMLLRLLAHMSAGRSHWLTPVTWL